VPHTEERRPELEHDDDRRATTTGHAPDMREKVADAVRRHRAGDRHAMTDLVRIVSPWLRAVARSYGLSQYSAEDVAQTTLLVLLRQVDKIRSPEAALTWLAVVARREAMGVARAERAVRLVADVEADEPCRPASGPEAITIEKMRRNLLWQHVAVLPDRAQLILREIATGDRPSYSAISRRAGMPVGSIGPTRRRSLTRVRRLLEADEDWRAYA